MSSSYNIYLGILSPYYNECSSVPIFCATCASKMNILSHQLNTMYDLEVLLWQFVKQKESTVIKLVEDYNNLLSVVFIWLAFHSEVGLFFAYKY